MLAFSIKTTAAAAVLTLGTLAVSTTGAAADTVSTRCYDNGCVRMQCDDWGQSCFRVGNADRYDYDRAEPYGEGYGRYQGSYDSGPGYGYDSRGYQGGYAYGDGYPYTHSYGNDGSYGYGGNYGYDDYYQGNPDGNYDDSYDEGYDDYPG